MRSASGIPTLFLAALVLVTAPLMSCAKNRRAKAPAPPPAVATIRSSEPWTFGATPGRLIRTTHYRLFTTLPLSLLTDRMPEFLESSLTEYRSRLGPLPAPPNAMDTYIVAGRAQWSRLAARLIGPQAGAFQTIPRGGLTSGGRAILYDIGMRDTFALAAHEGWHQYTQSTFGRPLPTWLEEGLATTFEGFVWDEAGRAIFRPWANLERYDRLRSVMAWNRLLPLEQLFDAGPATLAAQGTEGTLDYYAQVWALAMFLREGENGRYGAGLRRMVSDAAGGGVIDRTAGQSGASALVAAYFSTDLSTLNAQFARFVGRVVRAGARDQVTRGESPA